MHTDYYSPHTDALKPFFGEQSKIDSREKAFAFILGVLIGAILRCRSLHDKHSGSGIFPLSQLLTLTGDDLRALHDKVIRELNHTLKNTKDILESVVEESRHLHASLSRSIDLDEDTTTYFILYGISVSSSICNSDARKVKKCHL